MDQPKNPTKKFTIAALGKQYMEISPFGSVTIQVTASTGLQFKVYGTNDDRQTFSNVPYGINGDLQVLGDATPVLAVGDLVDVVLGNMLELAIDVTAGTGAFTVVAGNGLKLL